MSLLLKVIKGTIARDIRFSPETLLIGERIMPDTIYKDDTYHSLDGNLIAKENMAGGIELVKCKLRIKHTILQMINIEMDKEKVFIE